MNYPFKNVFVFVFRVTLLSVFYLLDMTLCVCLGERAEGAERKPENTTRPIGLKSTTLEEGTRRLSLQHTDKTETFSATAPLLLLNSV